MHKILIIVDMQNDFIDGALGTDDAVAIVDNASKKAAAFDGDIIVTYDTHNENYQKTQEGRKLPVEHCIKGTYGWQLNDKIKTALNGKTFLELEKPTFGSLILPKLIEDIRKDDELYIELIGLCTDICVVSNALLLKAAFPEADITVDSNCCAGVSKAKHEAALETMRSCQINVI
ncbi:MAG: cysteine hydrolase [Clostridia bacterium]|nr:cysteine hydrolase [Clostridia bacterium]